MNRIAIRNLTNGLSVDELNILIEEAKQRIGEIEEEKYTNNLTDELKILESFVSCEVKHSYEEEHDMKTEISNTVIQFKQGKIRIDVKYQRIGNGRRASEIVNIDTSFGKAYYYGPDDFEVNFKPIRTGPINWTIYDIAKLLQIVTDTTMPNTTDAEIKFNNFDLWNYEERKWTIDEEEKTESEEYIFENLVTIVAKYGYDDVSVEYLLNQDEERCGFYLYKNGVKDAIVYYVTVDNRYNIFVDSLNNLMTIPNLTIDDYYDMIASCLPSNGDIVAVAKRFEDKQEEGIK